MQRSISQFVLSASEGLTGEISRLLNEGAALAITEDTEHCRAAESVRARTSCSSCSWSVETNVNCTMGTIAPALASFGERRAGFVDLASRVC